MTTMNNFDFSSFPSSSSSSFSTSASSSSSNNACQLSPAAHALSTVLLALIGSIINGLSSGAFVAFLTGWIAWLAVIRVVITGLYEYWLAFKIGRNWSQAADVHEYESLPGGGVFGRLGPSQNPTTGWYGNGNDNSNSNENGTAYAHDYNTSYSNTNMYNQPPIPMNGFDQYNQPPGPTTNFDQYNNAMSYPPPQQQQQQPQRAPSPPPSYYRIPPFLRNKGPSAGPAPNNRQANWLQRGLVKEIKFTGWLGWVWSAFYTPISQTIWLSVNYNATSNGAGGIKIARAIAIGVSALPLAFDTRARYGAVLGRKLGSWAFILFNVWNATVCLLLGVECLVLLIRGAMQVEPPIPFYIVYPLFSLVWAFGSYKLLPTRNAGRKGVNIVVDVLVGAFAGIFVAAPAFIVWRWASFDERVAGMRGDSGSTGLNFGDYFSCEGVGFLDKFAAVMP